MKTKEFNKELFAKCIIHKKNSIEREKGKRVGYVELGKEIGISATTLIGAENIYAHRGTSINSIIKICEWMKTDICNFIKTVNK